MKQLKHKRRRKASRAKLKRAVNWSRLTAASIVGSVLFAGLALQAASMASTRVAPDLAVTLLPSNGLARERLLFAEYSSGNPGQEGMPVPSPALVEAAKEAMSHDPLVPKAYVVLALAEPEASVKRRMIESASSLNRRDLALQSLVLNQNVAALDYSRSINSLDQILRVHPAQSQQFFPVLAQALTINGTVPQFASLLDGSAPWHELFLDYAVKRDVVLTNLAALRPELDYVPHWFDRVLIMRLASIGELPRSERLYQMIQQEGRDTSSDGKLNWRSEFPPFDWSFADEAGFRAQELDDGKRLEVSIRPGKGGVFARRVIKPPTAPFQLSIAHSVRPATRADDVRLGLICSGQSGTLLDEEFRASPMEVVIEEVSSDCDYLTVTLSARAWTGQQRLNIELDQITIDPLSGAS